MDSRTHSFPRTRAVSPAAVIFHARVSGFHTPSQIHPSIRSIYDAGPHGHAGVTGTRGFWRARARVWSLASIELCKNLSESK